MGWTRSAFLAVLGSGETFEEPSLLGIALRTDAGRLGSLRVPTLRMVLSHFCPRGPSVRARSRRACENDHPRTGQVTYGAALRSHTRSSRPRGLAGLFSRVLVLVLPRCSRVSRLEACLGLLRSDVLIRSHPVVRALESGAQQCLLCVRARACVCVRISVFDLCLHFYTSCKTSPSLHIASVLPCRFVLGPLELVPSSSSSSHLHLRVHLRVHFQRYRAKMLIPRLPTHADTLSPFPLPYYHTPSPFSSLPFSHPPSLLPHLLI